MHLILFLKPEILDILESSKRENPFNERTFSACLKIIIFSLILYRLGHVCNVGDNNYTLIFQKDFCLIFVSFLSLLTERFSIPEH